MPEVIKIQPDATGSVAVTPTVEYLSEMGAGIIGRAVTATLYVCPEGDDTNGYTWATAYTTIQGALDAASTDGDECTAIIISPHTTFYNINTTGAPTWTGNYEIIGSHRLWAVVKNLHASATCVMKFTGKVSIRDLAIFQDDTNDCDGVIFTGSGYRIRQCGFNSEGLGGAATSIYIDGSGGITRGGIIEDIQILGHQTYTKGLRINTSKVNEFRHMHIHKCLTGVQMEGATSDYNTFQDTDIGECTIGIDIDSGNEPFFHGLTLHHNTTNIDDEVGDAIWLNLEAELDVTLEPDNFTGVTVATHANADTWTTTPVEIRSAATSTVPFKIVATLIEADAAEKFRVRLSHDSGVTWFDDISTEGAVNAQKREAAVAPTSTDHIFNKGTQVVAASKCESGGNNVVVWIEIQEV